MWSWFKKRRRRRLLAQPFPEAWLEYIQANVHHYAHLLPADQARLRDLTRIFVAEKNWVPCGGLEIGDEVKVTIAAQACLLLLGIPADYCFDSIKSVLVYPGAYVHPRYPVEGQPTYGEAWHRGPIILAWDQALAGGREARNGQNLVLHEFAHHLDDLDGAMDGVPPLESREAYRRWYRVTDREYDRLCQAARRSEVTLLDQYGASNHAEFFAVATECFFQRPAEMQGRYPELYEVLRSFYGQHPAAWYGGPADWAAEQDDAQRQQQIEARYEESVRQCVREMRLDPRSADGLFAAGVVHAENAHPDRAVEYFNAAIELDPADGEAYYRRAVAQVERGRLAEALHDCGEALRIDPNDVEAYRTRGDVYRTMAEHARAVADFDQVLARDKKDADAYYQRGLARSALGQFTEAVSDFSRAIRYAPSQVEYYAARARAHEQLGMLKKAAADRAEAQRRGGDS
jgi:Mlc titration factor MtfA (ptsG expression regulator)/Flp pilus assembly protein TadD